MEIGRALLSIAMAFVLWTGQSWGQSTLTHGHQVLLDKGLQIETLCMPTYIMNDGGTFNLDLYKEANFTTINFWNGGCSYDYFANRGLLPSGTDAFPFSYLVSNTTMSATTPEYASNLVRLQYGDEQDLIPSSYPGWATTIATLKAKYPDTIVYMNNDEMHYFNASSLSNLNSFVQAVKPDMLSFTEYPFRWQDAPYHDYEGGSPTLMYAQIELYRKAGLAGLTGDGSQPIPVSMFVQTFAHVANTSTNHRQPTESEFRLQQFAGWASGMKTVDSFLYMNLPTELDSMLFEGTNAANQTPTTQFYQYAELNRQSLNLGDALVRLISTDFRMKMGSHGTGTGVTNTLPYGVSSFTSTADPYLTNISATNLGTLNNGLSGDVLYGSFKPIDPSLVRVGEENDHYFMIVNGLSDGTGTATDCRQQIHLDFDFSTSGINSLLRLSRETGQVEAVPLVHNGGSLYSLDLTLDGGTGDLFRYNTGSAFIGRNVEVAYRETFPSTLAANTSLDSVGWKLHYDATGKEYDGSFVGTTPESWRAFSVASFGLPGNLAGVNSNSHITEQEVGCLYFSKLGAATPDHNVLAWTDEVAASCIEKADLYEVSWYEGNDDSTEMRLALKIDDNWYVTEATYANDSDGAGIGMGAGYKMVVSDFSEANWNPLTLISGTEMSRSDTLVSLPEGLIQAAGIYSDDMISDASCHRFDTFEIKKFVTEIPIVGDNDGQANAVDATILLASVASVPEPSTIMLLFMATASLLIWKHRC